MSGTYGAMPPLLNLTTPGAPDRRVVLNANHIVSVRPSDTTGHNAGGSVVELITGRKVEITLSPAEFWELV